MSDAKTLTAEEIVEMVDDWVDAGLADARCFEQISAQAKRVPELEAALKQANDDNLALVARIAELEAEVKQLRAVYPRVMRSVRPEVTFDDAERAEYCADLAAVECENIALRRACELARDDLRGRCYWPSQDGLRAALAAVGMKVEE